VDRLGGGSGDPVRSSSRRRRRRQGPATPRRRRDRAKPSRTASLSRPQRSCRLPPPSPRPQVRSIRLRSRGLVCFFSGPSGWSFFSGPWEGAEGREWPRIFSELAQPNSTLCPNPFFYGPHCSGRKICIPAPKQPNRTGPWGWFRRGAEARDAQQVGAGDEDACAAVVLGDVLGDEERGGAARAGLETDHGALHGGVEA
jgi:hypothetical protein